MTKKKERITLEQIMLNAPREIEVEGYGTILVRDPTKQDRIDARKEASSNPIWEQLTDEEKNLETLDRLMFRIIVEPKIAPEDYLGARETAIRDILDSVILDYTKRLRELSDKRKRTLKSFLDLMKVSSPGTI